MTTWKPRPVAKPYAILELQTDRRYQVRPVWMRGADGVMRMRYRAYINDEPVDGCPAMATQREALDAAGERARSTAR